MIDGQHRQFVNAPLVEQRHQFGADLVAGLGENTPGRRVDDVLAHVTADKLLDRNEDSLKAFLELANDARRELIARPATTLPVFALIRSPINGRPHALGRKRSASRFYRGRTSRYRS